MYAWLDYALFYLTKELEKSFLILKLDTTMSFCLLSFLTLHIEWPQKNKQNLCNWKESIHFLFDWSQSITEKFDLILYIWSRIWIGSNQSITIRINWYFHLYLHLCITYKNVNKTLHISTLHNHYPILSFS